MPLIKEGEKINLDVFELQAFKNLEALLLDESLPPEVRANVALGTVNLVANLRIAFHPPAQVARPMIIPNLGPRKQ